jgi:hypothetical protein
MFHVKEIAMKSRSSILFSGIVLTVGLTQAAWADDGAEPPPPKPPVRVVLWNPKPLQPTAEWSALVLDLKKRDAAPAKFFIADAEAWSKLWRTWRGDEQLPEVNFQKEILLVSTALGPNHVILKPVLNPGGNVSLTLGQTVRGGPGFTYRIVSVPRAGVKSVQGQPVN